ncbi:efflux RND transporter periplasmic adaptor subunit [Flammeovirga pectinis]|uniref:Efflux RND transporter periplasmic adaptor subunit n=1 Tax=Flammeovirga pectinis TaxID=2494373 RepID=A0A3S9P5L2_9BACT|nr:efflux RND transporter periplasmic adaptor subunit [Flammeovirga pectinis]AZQ63394.1 efflux RND transporter periplasmic adaptor subunit [Flammeovirga pectinis]
MKAIYKLIAGVIFVTSLGFIIQSCTQSTAKNDKSITKSKGLTNSMKSIVTTANVTSSSVIQEIKLTGTVEALPNKQIRIPAIVSGRVTSVNVSLGDQVRKGQILARIYSSDMAAVKQEWIEAKANVDREVKEFDVAQSLFDAGLSSALELQQAKSELEAANAQLNRINQTMKLMGESDNATHIVRAPMGGTITERNITANMMLREDFEDALFTIVDLSDVWLKINVFESDIRKVKLGANVKAEALAHPGDLFEGQINKMGKLLDPETKVLDARVEIKNTEMKLLPNMAMNVTVFEELDQVALKVPSNAVVFHNNKEFIVKKNGDNFSMVNVKVMGNASNDKVYIEGDLEENDTVVSEKTLLVFNELVEAKKINQ